MKTHKDRQATLVFLCGLALFVLACSLTSPSGTATPTATLTSTPTLVRAVDATKTSTPTVTILDSTATSPPEGHCQGLSGTVEIQILVGPAAATGMEPMSVGEIPFAVSAQDQSIDGNTHLAYANTTPYDWGSYAVNLDLDASLTGKCADNLLNMSVELSGDQNVIVVYDQITQTYPWNGSASVDASFPLEEGATAQGGGWLMVLHLDEN